MSGEAPHLSVEKRPFLQALKSLRISARARQKDLAVLSFQDGRLHIRLHETGVSVPALGQWPGSARVIARTLIPVVTFPPDPDPLPLRFEGDRFYIAGWSVNATWHAQGGEPIETAAEPTALDLVALRRERGDEALEASGLLEEALEAERSLAGKLSHAARILRPVGISLGDLEDLVERKLEAIRSPRD